MGSLYRSQHELVFVFKHGRADHPTMSSAAAMCWRSPIWSWPRGSSCSVSRREFSLSLWPGRCSASAWPWDFMIRYLPTLTGLYGRTARRPITGITLIAGFASTVGWPLSAFLDAQFGWRAACLIWAALHILIGLPLNRLLIPVAPPPMRASEIEGEVSPAPPGAMATLAFVFATTWFVTGAMAAHPPRLLEIAGASTTSAIAAAALVGPAQVAARLVEFGALRRVHPLVSVRLAALLHPIGAVILAVVGPGAITAFAVLHGAGNGLLTIAKGTALLCAGARDAGGIAAAARSF